MKQVEIENLIVEIIKDIKGKKFQVNSNIFDEIGLDSLTIVRVMVNLEEETGAKLKEEGIDWRGVSTIKDLAKIFCEYHV